MTQLGAGKDIGAVDERDREALLSDPFSTTVEMPKDMRSQVIMNIFNATSFEYGQNGLTGFNYLNLKDTIRWNGCKPQDFVPILNSCINHFIKGVNSKAK